MLIILETKQDSEISKNDIKANTPDEYELILMTKNEVKIDKIKKSLKESGIKPTKGELILRVERNVVIEM